MEMHRTYDAAGGSRVGRALGPAALPTTRGSDPLPLGQRNERLRIPARLDAEVLLHP
eukprot:COSAG06_NODE_49809_length_323_cov_0.566964_1_plen_56_part_10